MLVGELREGKKLAPFSKPSQMKNSSRTEKFREVFDANQQKANCFLLLQAECAKQNLSYETSFTSV